jgi:hypothetical protein
MDAGSEPTSLAPSGDNNEDKNKCLRAMRYAKAVVTFNDFKRPLISILRIVGLQVRLILATSTTTLLYAWKE